MFGSEHMAARRRSSKVSRYHGAVMAADMEMRGWTKADLAAKAGVSAMTVIRFLRDEVQTAKTARKLARALGHKDAGPYLQPVPGLSDWRPRSET
jgi:transcriptional regulator with XRE-family HTH domain